MIVICEECGKKYRVDPTKIKGKAASFKCHICNHVIMVYKAHMPSTHADAKLAATPTAFIGDASGAVQNDKIDSSVGAGKASAGRHHHRKTGGVGLRIKMLLVFLFIPLLLIAGGSIFYLWYFETASDLIVQENSSIATELAEQKADEAAQATERENEDRCNK